MYDSPCLPESDALFSIKCVSISFFILSCFLSHELLSLSTLACVEFEGLTRMHCSLSFSCSGDGIGDPEDVDD